MRSGYDFVPKIFTLLKSGYSIALFKKDLIAGLTVAIVALPLAMALAIASGASPDKGLVTAVVAGFFISFLGGSRVQIGGPTGAFVVVVYNVIGQHGYEGLILATFLAGLLLIAAGYMRLGGILKFIPHPVIIGFTAGIAVIIATSQVKDFFGLHIDAVPADFLSKWRVYFETFSTLHLATVGIGLFSLLIILFCRRYAPKWPSYLIAVVGATTMVSLLHIPVETIGTRFPTLPTGLPMPQFPVWTFIKIKEVIPSALTIAFLAGIEALLSAVVADGMTGYKHRSNQELVAQGVANMASALFGGLPATGALARTATNVKSGAKTPVAGLLHAVFLLLFVLFAMKAVAYIPMSSLAAILFVVAWGMSEKEHFIHIFRIPSTDRLIMLLTFALTALVDLTVAIAVGVILAALLFMRQMMQAFEIQAEKNHLVSLYGDSYEEEAQRQVLPAGVEVFRVTGPLFFGVAEEMMDALQTLGQNPKVLILRLHLVPYLDVTGVRALRHVLLLCQERGVPVILSGLQKQPENLLRSSHLLDGIEHAANYLTAVKLAEKWIIKTSKAHV